LPELGDTYDPNVFINCPFDRGYPPIFDAIVFAILDCGFRPLCARERMNSAQIRLEKISELIRDSRSIHDLSRVETNGPYSLPRFNMPLELGIALGCAKFGEGRHRDKSLLVLDRRRYRYHRFVSDLSGQDISEHRNRPARAIEAVRNWLRTESADADIPGPEFITGRYPTFQRELPRLAALTHLNSTNLSYVDYCFTISEWVKANARAIPTA
jgi:hypothetical protein